MAVEIETFENLTLCIVGKAPVVVRAETIVLLLFIFAILLLLRQREQVRRLAAMAAYHKAVLRHFVVVVHFRLCAILHLHAIVHLVEIQVVAKLDAEAHILHGIGSGRSVMAEHVVAFQDIVLAGALVARIIESGVVTAHLAFGSAELQRSVSVHSPGRVAALWALATPETVLAFQRHAVALRAEAHLCQGVLPVERGNTAHAQLLLLGVEVISWCQFSYACRSRAHQLKSLGLYLVILRVLLLPSGIDACLQLYACLGESIVGQQTRIGHVFYHALTHYQATLFVGGLYQTVHLFHQWVVRLDLFLLLRVLIQLLNQCIEPFLQGGEAADDMIIESAVTERGKQFPQRFLGLLAILRSKSGSQWGFVALDETYDLV